MGGGERRIMSIPLPIPGFQRFLARPGVDARREVVLRDRTGEEVLRLQGKPSTQHTARIRDTTGRAVLRVVGHRIGDRRRVALEDGEGRPVAMLDATAHRPSSGQLLVSMSSGAEWHFRGELAAAVYYLTMAGERIMRVAQRVDGTRILDLDPDVDPGVSLAVVWVVDLIAQPGQVPLDLQHHRV